MAHFAQLNPEGVVINVVVVSNANMLDSSGVEQEAVGIAYLEEHVGQGPWVQTSYSHSLRGKYAGIGDYFDKENNVFTSPPSQEA